MAEHTGLKSLPVCPHLSILMTSNSVLFLVFFFFDVYLWNEMLWGKGNPEEKYWRLCSKKMGKTWKLELEY